MWYDEIYVCIHVCLTGCYEAVLLAQLGHKKPHYLAGTGLQHPGDGCYLGCDPEGVHYCSTSADYPTLAHELGHVAEMGTYGYCQCPRGPHVLCRQATRSEQHARRFIDHPQVGWLWECCSQWLLYYFHKDKAPSIMSWLEAHNKPLDNFDCRYDSWLFLYHLQVRNSMLVVELCMVGLCGMSAGDAWCQGFISAAGDARSRSLPLHGCSKTYTSTQACN